MTTIPIGGLVPIGSAEIVETEKGFHIELNLIDGRTLIQEQPPFPTREGAQAALDRFIEANGIEKVKLQ